MRRDRERDLEAPALTGGSPNHRTADNDRGSRTGGDALRRPRRAGPTNGEMDCRAVRRERRLAKGARFFAEGHQEKLELMDTKTYARGVVSLRFRPSAE